jgi:hypothetical protein
VNANELTSAIIGGAIEVHRRLCPGLLESAYRVCLAYELRKRGLEVVEERDAQTLSHLRLMGLRIGLLINFQEAKLVDGVHRIINGYE